MTRMSKPAQRRAVSPRRRRAPGAKTGPKKDLLPLGYRDHSNGVEGELANSVFIPKIS